MRRRAFLQGLGTVGLIAWTGIRPARVSRAAPACTLSPSQTPGPFYFNPNLLRRDITEGRPGAPVRLRLQVVDAGSCMPIPNALVDIWHTDAAGLYSGYRNQGENNVDTRGMTFLRGIQLTDAEGVAEFATIYPGWYPGRVAHIHFKVHIDDVTYVTSQLYLPDEVSSAVYTTAPYAARGQSPITNLTDQVLRPGQLEKLLATVAAAESGYAVDLAIGIDLPQPTATASPADTATAVPEPSTTPAVCTGDCSGDGTVTIDEMVNGVNMALGNPPAEGCSAFDRDGDHQVTVAELIAAVNNVLHGCGTP